MSSITTTQVATPSARKWKLTLGAGNRRSRTVWTIIMCLLFFAAIGLGSYLIGEAGLKTSLTQRNMAPTLAHPLGTDWLGRDMLTRTLLGLSLSLRVGLLAALISAVLGVVLGLLAAMLGGKVDLVITWFVDVFFSLPHLVLLILISFALGGGLQGVLIAVALTHWPGLTRVIRAEALQVKSSDYVQLSARLGHSPWWIARHHTLPHLIPQFLVGLILLFPHAILHEAGLTFVGIGLSPHTPAIGIILAESMRHLSTGYWWLGVFPGLALLVAVKAFDILGENVRTLIDPKTSQE
ncbi:MAG: ABC transporter permease [Anaerolineae bacterium]|nr:ABC transporter permease [Anaerolineales bacterium]MCQ3977168.1 ABC transporter permease [Anaerolineae bacterium]